MTFLSQPILLVAVAEVVIGIVLLARSADEFVDGAVGVAIHARMSPVLVGAVVVGFGTSAPELLVSAIAAANGDLALGVGNIVGSNVANLTLVLGAAALLVPLVASRAVLIREAPLSLLAVLAFAYAVTGGLQRWEGLALLAALVGALSWVIAGGVDHDHGTGGDNRGSFGSGDRPGPSSLSAAAAEPTQSDRPSDTGTLGSNTIRTILGLVGTVLGAQFLVWGATAIAAEVGLTGGFVGFTLVAVGTSLPELVTAGMAARRGATELLLGNLLGSNIFNSLAVGGVIALIGPGPIGDDGLSTIGVGVMVAVALGAWFAMVTLRRVHRIEAVVLLSCWLVAVLLLARTGIDPDLAAF